MNDRISLVGTEGTFEHAVGFDAGQAEGGFRLGKFEAQYEELFAEVIEDGIITVEERARLDRAADLLGLDKSRLAKLEQALQFAYEAHNKIKIVVEGGPASIDPRASLAPLQPSSSAVGDPAFVALQKRVAFLEGRVKHLEAELEEARSNVAVEVDLGSALSAGDGDEPDDLQRRVRQDPTDADALHALYRAYSPDGRAPALDKQVSVGNALSFLGRAHADQRALADRHRRAGQLPKPTSAVSSDAWRKLLFHPDAELLTGDLFAVITSAVLLGRVSALRRDKLLPKLDPTRRQDVATSTISAVRALGWSAAILGLTVPPIYVDPESNEAIEMIPGVPPNVRIGHKILSGRSPQEVAFECGRALAGFREEHFVRSLFPGVTDLEDLFLASLTIGNPALPIPVTARARVAPIAAAIEPVLEPAQVDRLRGGYLRFVEEGGRTNLQRWAQGVDKTACRAGLLLSGDLTVAAKVLSQEKPPRNGVPCDEVQDLIAFSTSDRWFSLRRQLGIAIVGNGEAAGSHTR